MSDFSSITAGFMAEQQFDGIGLQNRCTTTVLSRPKGGFPRESWLFGQREKRRRRSGQRFKSAQGVAQYAHALFRKQIGPERGCCLAPTLTDTMIGASHGLP